MVQFTLRIREITWLSCQATSSLGQIISCPGSDRWYVVKAVEGRTDTHFRLEAGVLQIGGTCSYRLNSCLPSSVPTPMLLSYWLSRYLNPTTVWHDPSTNERVLRARAACEFYLLWQQKCMQGLLLGFYSREADLMPREVRRASNAVCKEERKGFTHRREEVLVSLLPECWSSRLHRTDLSFIFQLLSPPSMLTTSPMSMPLPPCQHAACALWLHCRGQRTHLSWLVAWLLAEWCTILAHL